MKIIALVGAVLLYIGAAALFAINERQRRQACAIADLPTVG